jgi:hypothetical protein
MDRYLCGNDFHEDDYYYLNNGDGTFGLKHFGHTSRFSMGVDVAILIMMDSLIFSTCFLKIKGLKTLIG